jgi:hypothetical protein
MGSFVDCIKESPNVDSPLNVEFYSTRPDFKKTLLRVEVAWNNVFYVNTSWQAACPMSSLAGPVTPIPNLKQ